MVCVFVVYVFYGQDVQDVCGPFCGQDVLSPQISSLCVIWALSCHCSSYNTSPFLLFYLHIPPFSPSQSLPLAFFLACFLLFSMLFLSLSSPFFTPLSLCLSFSPSLSLPTLFLMTVVFLFSFRFTFCHVFSQLPFLQNKCLNYDKHPSIPQIWGFYKQGYKCKGKDLRIR